MSPQRRLDPTPLYIVSILSAIAAPPVYFLAGFATSMIVLIVAMVALFLGWWVHARALRHGLR